MNMHMKLLRQYNLKATPQRLAIIDAINEKGHITLDSLYSEIKQRFNSISLATIYKNIRAMTENKLLLEVKLSHSRSVYEIAKNTHAHLRCEVCGDFQDAEIDAGRIFHDTLKKFQFKINNTDIIISGICKNCTD